MINSTTIDSQFVRCVDIGSLAFISLLKPYTEFSKIRDDTAKISFTTTVDRIHLCSISIFFHAT